MKKTIIAIWGQSKQGKSSTIKLIRELIIKDFPSSEVINYSPQKSYYDIELIILNDKFKIGIISKGDPNSNLKKRLKNLTEENCDIILCATRTSGETVNAVDSFNSTYDIIWATNYRSENNYENLNNLAAEHIYQLINKIIKS